MKKPNQKAFALASRSPVYMMREEAFNALLPRLGYFDWDDDDEEEQENAIYRVTSSGVAIININGVLMDAQADWYWCYYGYCSTPEIKEAVVSATQDANVKSILLYINSPGGQASGIADLADAVYLARSAKPTVAFAKDACSAAYWVASQCEKLYITQDAYVGSIGTLLTVYDWSAYYQEMGVKVYSLTSDGAETYKGAMTRGTEITDDQRADLKRILNGHQALFNQGISRGRGSFDTALADGRFYLGQEAVGTGLCDAVTSFDAVLALLDAGMVAEPEAEPEADDNDDDGTQDHINDNDGDADDSKPTSTLTPLPSLTAESSADTEPSVIDPAGKTGSRTHSENAERSKFMSFMEKLKALFQSEGIKLEESPAEPAEPTTHSATEQARQTATVAAQRAFATNPVALGHALTAIAKIDDADVLTAQANAYNEQAKTNLTPGNGKPLGTSGTVPLSLTGSTGESAGNVDHLLALTPMGVKALNRKKQEGRQ